MSKLIPRTRLIVIGSLIAFATTGCGANKADQCSSFDKIAKEAETAAKVFDSPDLKDPNKSAQIFSSAAAKSLELNKSIRSLDLQDEKLKGFQSKFAAIYEEYGKSFSQISLAAKAKDAQSFNKPIAELEAGSVKEKAVAKELAEYCTGK
jgi:hypothetical protein